MPIYVDLSAYTDYYEHIGKRTAKPLSPSAIFARSLVMPEYHAFYDQWNNHHAITAFYSYSAHDNLHWIVDHEVNGDLKARVSFASRIDALKAMENYPAPI